jgi:hypothetical protein
MSNLREELVRRLETLGISDLQLQGRDDGFSSLSYGGKPFAHFHNDNELDIYLTKDTIQREGLVHPTNSLVHPKRAKGSHWIEVRFTQAAELHEVVRLVKLAIAQL